jgi:hypothetical protein
MSAQSLLALGITILLGVAGCKKASEDGGSVTPSSPSSKEEDNAAKELAQAKQTSINNLAQIGLALQNYHDALAVFPSSGTPGATKPAGNWVSPHSWRVAILPYIEQAAIWQYIPDNGRAPLPKHVSETVIKLYRSPLAKDPKPQTNYRVFVGNGAAFEWDKPLRITDFTDGVSVTILAVESAEPIDWASLDDFNYDPKKPLPKLGIFPGGFHALMGDGRVRWIPSDTPEATIRAMITRNGGETLELPGTDVTPKLGQEDGPELKAPTEENLPIPKSDALKPKTSTKSAEQKKAVDPPMMNP